MCSPNSYYVLSYNRTSTPRLLHHDTYLCLELSYRCPQYPAFSLSIFGHVLVVEYWLHMQSIIVRDTKDSHFDREVKYGASMNCDMQVIVELFVADGTARK